MPLKGQDGTSMCLVHTELKYVQFYSTPSRVAVIYGRVPSKWRQKQKRLRHWERGNQGQGI